MPPCIPAGATCGAVTNFPNGIAPASSCAAKFITPNVLAVARAYFSCPSLNGAELENQNPGCQIVGSHWEQVGGLAWAGATGVACICFLLPRCAAHLLHGAHGVVRGTLALTLTRHAGAAPGLGLVRARPTCRSSRQAPSKLLSCPASSSHRYIANYSAADPLYASSSFGFRQGCAFATQRCLTGSPLVGQGTPPHFYGTAQESSAGGSVCTTDRLAIAHVSLATYSSAIPAQFQYFSGSTTGGTLPTADYCPTVSAYTNTRCWAAGDASAGTAQMGMVFGSGSTCMASNLLWSTL